MLIYTSSIYRTWLVCRYVDVWRSVSSDDGHPNQVCSLSGTWSIVLAPLRFSQQSHMPAASIPASPQSSGEPQLWTCDPSPTRRLLSCFNRIGSVAIHKPLLWATLDLSVSHLPSENHNKPYSLVTVLRFCQSANGENPSSNHPLPCHDHLCPAATDQSTTIPHHHKLLIHTRAQLFWIHQALWPVPLSP